MVVVEAVQKGYLLSFHHGISLYSPGIIAAICMCLLFIIYLSTASHLRGDCNNEKHLNVMFFRDVQNVKYLRRSPLSLGLSALCIDLSLPRTESHGPWSGGNLWRQLRERGQVREDNGTITLYWHR